MGSKLVVSRESREARTINQTRIQVRTLGSAATEADAGLLNSHMYTYINFVAADSRSSLALVIYRYIVYRNFYL